MPAYVLPCAICFDGQSLQVKHVIGNKQSSGGGGFAVHLLDGHIGTKFMAVMTLVVKEGGNDGIAPTPRRYSATKGECSCFFILSPTAVFPLKVPIQIQGIY